MSMSLKYSLSYDEIDAEGKILIIQCVSWKVTFTAEDLFGKSKKMRSLGKLMCVIAFLRDYQKYIQIGGVGQETSEWNLWRHSWTK